MDFINENMNIFIGSIIFVILGIVGYFFYNKNTVEVFTNPKPQIVIKEDNIEQITPMKVEPNTYTLLYTPYNHSYIVLNQLKVSQEITLQLNDGTTSTGVIESINYKEDSLTYKVGDEIKPIHFHFKGMPSDIVNIEKIYKEHDFEKDTIVEEEKSTEEEEGEVFYYYSLEQQMNDLKHDLETPDIMKSKE